MPRATAAAAAAAVTKLYTRYIFSDDAFKMSTVYSRLLSCGPICLSVTKNSVTLYDISSQPMTVTDLRHVTVTLGLLSDSKASY